MNSFQIDFGDQGFWSPEFLGLQMLSRNIGDPPKDDRTERVPYSSATYDFDALYGTPSYGERTIVYKFDVIEKERRKAEHILYHLKHDLRWTGCRDLYDSGLPDYHFEARAPTVKMEDGLNTVHLITVTFRAAPAMLPNQTPPLLESEKRYPDLNGDGHVTAADAALILTAAERIATGQSSGLTPSQELLADADLDGTITEADSLLVLGFASDVSSGRYEDNLQGWLKYLRRHLSMKGALY